MCTIVDLTSLFLTHPVAALVLPLAGAILLSALPMPRWKRTLVRLEPGDGKEPDSNAGAPS